LGVSTLIDDRKERPGGIYDVSITGSTDPSLMWQMIASWDNAYQGITNVDKFFLQSCN
jgi:hypothetical protein